MSAFHIYLNQQKSEIWIFLASPVEQQRSPKEKKSPVLIFFFSVLILKPVLSMYYDTTLRVVTMSDKK
jgi:hypothetical protein